MAAALDYRKHKVLFIFLFCFPVLFIIYSLFLQLDADKVEFGIKMNDNLPNTESSRDKGIPALKTILYWNHFFGIENFTFGFGHQPFIDAQCPTHTCTVTNDRMLFNRSDVVIFSVQNMNLSDLPDIRFAHQRFVFYEMESPANTDPQPLLHERIRFGFFNWTMTYRLDSDIVNRDSYGVIVPRKLTLPSMFPIARRSDPTATERKSIGGNKKKLLAWFVSNCVTPSQREMYVEELSRYVPIDIYGKCGNLTCTDRSDCREMLRTDYKFYVGFENSLCTDYVTEKLTAGFLYDTVPIVMGGVDYTQFAPPHSFIDVKDFDSPKELAKYLLLLNETDSLYDRYFDWKPNFDVHLDTKQGWCHLCKLANDERLPLTTYEDILQWWVDDPESCNLPVGNTPIPRTK
ncbi:Alpha-(1,3)-fucosyltransferase 7 [Daphnia magna]|uniref:Fucosyltransferase n=1 Tax=Daphnia magna TaxID=35525 RepID=A0A0P4XAH4_9CRUS|nr:Alpha-(1,3)-fucosyltransferase 7 [Daphnia magna]